MDVSASVAAPTSSYHVLGETLRPLLTNAMGSSIEILDITGPADAGPPLHKHPWEEIYVVLEGELEVTIRETTTRLKAGGVAHVPANTPHRLRNLTEVHFLSVVSRGNASRFFKQVATEVEMNPPDIAGVLRVGASNGITFL